MKILADVRLLARGEVSGIEEYTRNLFNALLAVDQENEYLFFYNGFKKRLLKDQISVENARVINWRIPNKIFDFSSRFLGLPDLGSRFKADIVFSPHFNILAGRAAPRVVTFHDLSFLHHPDFFSWRQRFWHWLQNIKNQAKSAEKIIAVSEFTKNDLVNTLGVPPEKIQVVYSGITEDFRLLAGRQPPLPNPYILYLGTLEPRKNVLALIKAFNVLKSESAFKDFKLILAGRRGWLYDNMLKEASHSFYKQDIIFWGPVSHEEKIRLYNFARVFVYPSFFEGFGFPPLEAQACGCPAIVADRTSLPEIMGQSAILVDPWKTSDMAEAIKKILLDSQFREKLVLAGLENIKRFSWQNTARATISIFKSL